MSHRTTRTACHIGSVPTAESRSWLEQTNSPPSATEPRWFVGKPLHSGIATATYGVKGRRSRDIFSFPAVFPLAHISNANIASRPLIRDVPTGAWPMKAELHTRRWLVRLAISTTGVVTG